MAFFLINSRYTARKATLCGTCVCGTSKIGSKAHQFSRFTVSKATLYGFLLVHVESHFVWQLCLWYFENWFEGSPIFSVHCVESHFVWLSPCSCRKPLCVAIVFVVLRKLVRRLTNFLGSLCRKPLCVAFSLFTQ